MVISFACAVLSRKSQAGGCCRNRPAALLCQRLGADHTNRNFLTPDDAVHAAALDILQHTEVIGGDLLMKRARQNSPSNIPETQVGNGAPDSRKPPDRHNSQP